MTNDRLFPPDSPPALPSSVWLLSWVSFFADVSSEMIYPLFPLFLVGVLGSSKTELGIIEGAAVLIVAIMTAYAGFRSDQMGRRVPWIRWGYGLPILGKTIIALATAWPLVLGGRLLDRFGKGLRGAPRDALIANAVEPEQRGRAFGVHRAFDTAGALVGVLLAALLLWWLTGTPQTDVNAHATAIAGQTSAWVYRAIFGIAAMLGAVSLVLTFLVREPEPASAATSLSEPAVKRGLKKRDILSLPRSYWSVFALLILFSLANSSDTFLLLRISDFGYSPWQVVLAYALYNFVYSGLSYPAGALSDRFGRWAIIASGWVVYTAVYLGFALLPQSMSWGMWPLMAVYGVYMALTDGVGKALIADCVPSERRGTAMGLFYAGTGITTLLASLIAGFAWDRSGGRVAFLISAAFAVIALVALRFVRRGDLCLKRSSE